jgi:hypothetical protein
MHVQTFYSTSLTTETPAKLEFQAPGPYKKQAVIMILTLFIPLLKANLETN